MSTVALRRTDTLDAEERRAVEELAAAAARADGVAPVGEQVLLALRAPAAGSHHLLAAVDGVLVGYAHLSDAGPEDGATPFVELVVHPGRRRAGTGSALLAAALADGGTGARVWSHGDLAPARALAEARGLHPVRELLQLRRSLAEPLPGLVVPDDLRLGPFDPDRDTDELLRVNAAAFAWHPEQGGWTRADVAARVAEPWFDPAGVFLARDARGQGGLLGFHWTKVHLDEPGLGEVYVVGVDPSAQGRGLGRVLTLAGLHHLAGRGLGTVELYVEGDNTAALHTYTRLGFTRAHADVAHALS